MIIKDVKKTRQAIDPTEALEPDLAKAPFPKTAMFFSTAELRRVSDEISRDYAPVFKKKKTVAFNRIKLSASELLAISGWVSQVYRPRPCQGKELWLLPLDPGHVYVHWNLPGKQPGIENQSKLDQHHLLKVFSAGHHNHGGGDDARQPLFEATVNAKGQNRTIIALPAVREDAGLVAVIGEQRPEKPFRVITRSNRIHLTNHRPPEPPVHPVMPVLTSGLQRPALSSSNRRLTASGQG